MSVAAVIHPDERMFVAWRSERRTETMRNWLNTQRDTFVRSLIVRGLLTLCVVGSAATLMGAGVVRAFTGIWPVTDAFAYAVAASWLLAAAISQLVVAASVRRALANALSVIELASDAKKLVTGTALRIVTSVRGAPKGD